MWISNTIENPNRKFWKCQNSRVRFGYFFSFIFIFRLTFLFFLILLSTQFSSVVSCELFIWDDEVGQVERTQKIPQNCKNCEMIMTYLREFGKDFGKEFSKQFGVEVSLKKHEKTKKSLRWRRVKVIV